MLGTFSSELRREVEVWRQLALATPPQVSHTWPGPPWACRWACPKASLLEVPPGGCSSPSQSLGPWGLSQAAHRHCQGCSPLGLLGSADVLHWFFDWFIHSFSIYLPSASRAQGWLPGFALLSVLGELGGWHGAGAQCMLIGLLDEYVKSLIDLHLESAQVN